MLKKKAAPYGKVPFETEMPAKWVFAGEHSVLRGAWALSLPHPELKLKFKFEPTPGHAFQVGQQEKSGAQETLEILLRTATGERKLPEGRLTLESSIPFDSGLGSSAALCAALTRWLAPEIGLQPSMQMEFARRLENHFHGKSSGMDVATVLAGKPIRFHKDKGTRLIEAVSLPKFSFHDTGFRAETHDCIAHVERAFKEDKVKGAKIDATMQEAADLGEKGLILWNKGDSGSKSEALSILARGMELGQSCFEDWELVPESFSVIEEKLKNEGALAVKLTGAGAGGFVVALWK